jgi:Uma2 family endonuclease
MSVAFFEGSVCIPENVRDLDSFIEWVCSGDVPEKSRYAFLNGKIWIQMSPEQFHTHNQLKGEFAFVLGGLIRKGRLGRFVHDGIIIRNNRANLSTEADGAFVSKQTLKNKRLQVVRVLGYDVLQGTPDMVLEVVSKSSEGKDYDELRELYWLAEIPEYWLVDPRGETLRFDILRRSSKGYVVARKQAGWVHSHVFDKSFRLTVQKDELGDPEYTLHVR